MNYEVLPDRHTPDTWRVEWTRDAVEGTFCVVIFCGWDAKELAEEYAAWKHENASRPALASAAN